MGTHPIFESDFDCLTDCAHPNRRFAEHKRKRTHVDGNWRCIGRSVDDEFVDGHGFDFDWHLPGSFKWTKPTCPRMRHSEKRLTFMSIVRRKLTPLYSGLRGN